MSNVLTDAEVERLVQLGKAIALDLSCDINDTGQPCLTCRLQAVSNMVEYLEIHFD